MKEIANDLLKIKAVFLRPNEPFTWASGIKSPIYCDNRLTLSYPEVRTQIENGLANKIKEEYPEVEMLMGTATAGIAHAALVANILNLPMGYVRSSAKSHGRNNQIEGLVIKGAKVVVVEDLISTGGSSIEVVEALRENGFVVLGVVSIFTYNLKAADENFKNANVKFSSIVDYHELIEEAIKSNYVSANDLEKLTAWSKDPKDESWMNK